MARVTIDGIGPDAPIVTTEKGGRQSFLPYRFDLLDGPAMFRLAGVLHYGAQNHGEDNWRKITTREHVNRCIGHLIAWLSGDQQDDHIGHALCRAMFAVANEEAKTRDGLPLGPENLPDPDQEILKQSAEGEGANQFDVSMDCPNCLAYPEAPTICGKCPLIPELREAAIGETNDCKRYSDLNHRNGSCEDQLRKGAREIAHGSALCGYGEWS